jgi:integrase/recombinase XerD
MPEIILTTMASALLTKSQADDPGSALRSCRDERVVMPTTFTVVGMTTSSDVDVSFAGDDLVSRLASSAYLARFTGTSRMHTESDLRLYVAWCAERQLAPLAAVRLDIERYVRWMQEVGRFKPSTVSRRMAVVTGFYRTCVIDAVLEHSPAEYVRRPVVAK